MDPVQRAQNAVLFAVGPKEKELAEIALNSALLARYNAAHQSQAADPERVQDLSSPLDVSPMLNARELHGWLAVRTDFATWFKRRISELGFIENQDFILLSETGKQTGRGQPKKEYHLSTDAAKHISMAERTPKGKEALNRLIEYERQFYAPAAIQSEIQPEPSSKAKQALKDAGTDMHAAIRARDDALMDKSTSSETLRMLQTDVDLAVRAFTLASNALKAELGASSPAEKSQTSETAPHPDNRMPEENAPEADLHSIPEPEPEPEITCVEEALPMKDIMTIHTEALGDAVTQTVNARDLHAFLEVGKDFSTWIKDRITQVGFVENQDFIVLSFDSPVSGNQTGRGGDRRSKEYHLTLDMAKHLAMIERNAKGKQARQYFIECERIVLQELRRKAEPQITDAKPRCTSREKAMSMAAIHSTFKHLVKMQRDFCKDMDMNQALLAAEKVMIAEFGVEIARYIPGLASGASAATESATKTAKLSLVTPIQDRYFSASDIGKQLVPALSGQAVNKWLCQLDFIARMDHGDRWSWAITETGLDYGRYLDTGKTHGGGTPVQQIKWRSNIIPRIEKIIAATSTA
ncbi:MAG: antA/AntB antirepressor family protein [Acidithiobacillus sp.]